MDVRIGAAPMAADAEIITPTVVVVVVSVNQVISLVERVAPFSCPSIAGTSISAVSPDYNFTRGLAKAA